MSSGQLNVEIGVKYQKIVVVVFLTVAIKCILRHLLKIMKKLRDFIAKQFILLFDYGKKQ